MIGVIAGSGFECLFHAAKRAVATTPFGRVTYLTARYGRVTAIVILRHGLSHDVPPHLLPSKGHVFAFYQMGIRKVLATSAVGSVNRLMQPGDMVVPDQFIDLTKCRDSTFHTGAVHTDFTEPYCAALRAPVVDAAKQAGLRVHSGGVYACTEGPRYETPAEVAMIGRLGGDLIGQSALPEGVLALELGLCYRLATVVSNWGAGLQESVTSRDILATVWQAREKLSAFMSLAVQGVAKTKRRKRCLETDLEAEVLAGRIKATALNRRA